MDMFFSKMNHRVWKTSKDVSNEVKLGVVDAKIIFMDFQSMYLFDGRILSFLRTPTDLTRFLEAWHSNASFQFCAVMKRKIILVLLAFMYNFRFQVCTHSMVTLFYFQFDVLSEIFWFFLHLGVYFKFVWTGKYEPFLIQIDVLSDWKWAKFFLQYTGLTSGNQLCRRCISSPLKCILNDAQAKKLILILYSKMSHFRFQTTTHNST